MKPGVVVLTGAGVSADSGLATFRGAGGLWEGHRVEEVATPEAWAHDPALVWRFYQLRRAALGEVQPNAAHHALVELERRVLAGGGAFHLVTQNVDDLHDRAGSRELLHMHGELLRLRCEACGVSRHDETSLDAATFLPCPACGHARLRPDIVWFGEVPLHLAQIEQAMARCTHFLALGTSGAVYPAAGLLEVARRAGAATWVNCLEAPDNLHPADTYREGRASEVVPELMAELLTALGM